MVKTKRQLILASCFVSGAAAIITLVSLGTREWITASATYEDDDSSVSFGLFGGTFRQRTALRGDIDLTTVCAYEYNICALFCGDDMVENLKKIYDNGTITVNDATCLSGGSTLKRLRAADDNTEPVFINAGVWLSTILFLVVSAAMGLFSAGLAVWNTATSPYQVYLSIFGLYIYNGIACFSLLLSIILWGAMYQKDMTESLPTYKNYVDHFKTEAQLGYSYWLSLVSLFLYPASAGLLYLRTYLISKEPKVNLDVDDNADPVIYLY